MIRAFFEAIFTLAAIGGLIMLVYGIRLKPDRAGDGRDAGEEILLDLPCQNDETSGLFEPGPSAETFGRQEKKAFDPEKHQPEKIESRKKD